MALKPERGDDKTINFKQRLISLAYNSTLKNQNKTLQKTLETKVRLEDTVSQLWGTTSINIQEKFD